MSNQVAVCPSCECSNTGPFDWCIQCIEERGWQAYALDLQRRLRQQERDMAFMRDMLMSHIGELEDQLKEFYEVAKNQQGPDPGPRLPCLLGD